MVNKVLLIGRVGKDPEIRRLDNGGIVGKFSLATSESYKDQTGNWQEKAEWHDIVVWNKGAERAERSVKKGGVLYVEGKITTRKWQDKDGNNRYTTEIVSSYFRTIQAANGQQNGQGNPNNQQSPLGNVQTMPMPEPKSSQPETQPESNDLPF